MKHSLRIRMEDYTYDLPHERIAEYPLDQRDASRLLVMRNGFPSEGVFRNIPSYLPENGMMVFNNTRVIRARLVFHKDTGARIEVFCLEPVLPGSEIAGAFEAGAPVTWKCLIGNAKKWRSGKLGLLLQTSRGEVQFEAERLGEANGAFLVRFYWNRPGLSFAEVLEAAGKVPLPPYIEREAEEEDVNRYQTVYAKHNGSVAAPTAGLHFTEDVMRELRGKNIHLDNLTLHVSAGTFKPVSHDDIREHEMHTEQVIVRHSLLEQLLANLGNITAVGTTSMRTLESLYWYGNELETRPDAPFDVKQWQPYESASQLPVEKAIKNIIALMSRKGVKELGGNTSLIILPSYRFRIVDMLVTNFHMPRSTLLLLVAAFAGDAWRDAYQYALENGFRFLSYGDSCLFFRKD
ncbi:MAG: S-adenosylmethionine:tRNA ribosyltransferase-isomerase [Bacteroidales bacterium]|jgi:S-adenosylmethionine:tRNA ribosyltransferase-isomerase|nr:S-adenosylmethionine:tRNA ribosyltransferase-isomerase [Bacteroidales bacterium]